LQGVNPIDDAQRIVMTGILPCTCSSACRAVSACDRPPRFQARLVAARNAQHPRIHGRTEACACHLGVMVVAMTTWAREQALTNADLTILTIEPPARESYPGRRRYRSHAQTSGLVFSIIHLGEPESMPANAPPASSDTVYRGFSALPAENLRHHGQLGFSTAEEKPIPVADAA
jgi:hypothetical protein